MWSSSVKLAKASSLTRLRHVRHQSNTSRGSPSSGTVVAMVGCGSILAVGGTIGLAASSVKNREAVEKALPGVSYLTAAVLGPAGTEKFPSHNPTLTPLYAPAAKGSANGKGAAKPEVTPAQPEEEAVVPVEDVVIDSGLLEAVKVETDCPPTPVVETNPPEAAVSTRTELETPSTPAIPLLLDSPLVIDTPSTPDTPLTADTRSPVPCVPLEECPPASPQDQVLTSARVGLHCVIGAVENIAQVICTETAALVNEGVELAEGRQHMSAALTSAVTEAQQLYRELAEDMALVEESAEGRDLSDLVAGVGRVLTGAEQSAAALTELLAEGAEVGALLPALCDTVPEVRQMAPREQLVLCLSFALRRSEAARSQQTAHGNAAETQAQLDALRHTLTQAHAGELARHSEALEADVRLQLRRQTEAHQEHVVATLERCREEMAAQAAAQVDEEAARLRAEHLQDLAGVKGRLAGLLEATQDAAGAECRARAGHALWTACEGLQRAVDGGQAEAGSYDEQLLPLQTYLAAVQAAAPEDPLVAGLLTSLDAASTGRGVYTAPALRQRWDRVASVARGVATVPEGGASLLRYLLAYLHASLLAPARPASTALDAAVDIHGCTQYDVLDHAGASVHVGDLMGALRWTTQLTGESRVVAADWCEEARRSLAAQQLAGLLMAYAVSRVAEAV